jgi:uncharacterized protein (TIGR00299 family) protein
LTIAYFDCFSGISGDMTLGALTDLGVPLDWLKDKLADVPLKGFDITIKKELRQGIYANRVHISIAEDLPSRTYGSINDLIQNSRLSNGAKEISLAIFEKVADAESKIHNEAKENVHFHEIGALDSIIDIVGTALCIEYLDIQRVVSSRIPLGHGFVSCRHGVIPVPVPATVEILKHIPVVGSGVEQELVTPTGAAIIAALADRFGDIPSMKIEKTGYGAGQRDNTPQPNILRIIKGVPYPESGCLLQEDLTEPIISVETSIDDMNPEFYGYLMDRLFEDGALDVYLVPVFMKKNRPGTLVQVLCKPDKKQAITHRIFLETTTIGVRFQEVHRQTLPRKHCKIKTIYGEVRVKQIEIPGDGPRFAPEYEECRKIAHERRIPLKEVYAEIYRATADNSLTKAAPDCRDEP